MGEKRGSLAPLLKIVRAAVAGLAVAALPLVLSVIKAPLWMTNVYLVAIIAVLAVIVARRRIR